MSAAAASVIGLAAAPALAASTWTVKPGGAVTAKAKGVKVTDTSKKPPVTVTCTSSALKGSLHGGTKLSGTGIGLVTSLTFTGCTFSGVTISVKITGKMPLNAVSYSAGVSSMTLTKIHGSLSVTTPITCSATIDGTSATANNGMVQAKFSNTTDTLTVSATGGNLHVYNPSSGCGTAVSNGDALTWAGAYKFTTKQTITSP
jgi:hypothetical protein